MIAGFCGHADQNHIYMS